MKRNGFKNLILNVTISIVSITIFFGSLEIWARYKYYGGFLTDHGFYSRGKKLSVKKNTPLRIVCVGGSTTHGGGNIENDQAYPAYLEQILNEKFHHRAVEVVNSGVSATPTEYHRDFIKERIKDQELDVLLVHSLYNHFSSFYPQLYNPNVDKIFIERSSRVRTAYRWDKMSPAEMINIFLMEHSHFYTRLHEKILMMRKADLGKYYKERAKYADSKDMEKSYEASTDEDKRRILASFLTRYRLAIEDMVLAAESQKVRTVLLIPPYPFFPEEMTQKLSDFRQSQFYNEVFEKARQILVGVGKEHQLLVIDADEEFQKRGRSIELFGDAVHLSPKGNYLLADIIASKMEPYLKDML